VRLDLKLDDLKLDHIFGDVFWGELHPSAARLRLDNNAKPELQTVYGWPSAGARSWLPQGWLSRGWLSRSQGLSNVSESSTISSPAISVIVPCYNEAEGINFCHERLTAVLRGLGESYEIVYVDDGSNDGTDEALQGIETIDSCVVVLRLSRNFGHQAAVSAGLETVRGQATVILDADMQDPPELIPEMVALWRQGYQVVYGVRDSREGETRFKVWTAQMFYLLINKLSDVAIPLDTGDFRLLDACVVRAFRKMPERHRLLRGMASWIGFTQIGIRYRRAGRYAGTTKYPLQKMLGLAVDGIVSFSTVPLRFVTAIGFISAAMAFLGIVYSLFVRIFTHSWVRGWALSFIGMLFMSGVQLLCLGVLGEYIGRIYTESKQRPLYILRDRTPRNVEMIHAVAEGRTTPETRSDRVRH
jgi:glycosyltransferase involved in cell wall biosynthesis